VIRGQVMAADTGTPLRRAQVRVFPASQGGVSALAQTDAQGRFEITELSAGRYTLSVSRSGYVTMQFGQRAPNQAGTPIEITDGQTVDKVSIVLPRGGAISGRIVDDLGEPVASVQVNVQRYAWQGGRRRLMPAGAEGGNARTDDLGQFRLYGLPPGDYFVSAMLRSMDSVPMNAVNTTTASDGFAPTYFPGTTNIAEARRITVRAAQDVPNVSFALVSARLGRVMGRVAASNGEPLVGGMLMIAPRGDDSFMNMRMMGADIRPDGTFQTTGLSPGRYTLYAQQRNFGGPVGEVGRIDVRVDGEDVRDVFITTGSGGTIRGRIVSDDGSPLPFKAAQVRMFGQPREPGEMGFGVRPPVVHDDFTFEMTGLTDAMRLTVSVADTSGGVWAARHAWKDNVDLLDEAIDVGQGQSIDEVEVVLTRKVTELSGLVTDDRNLPVTDAQVIVFPDDRDRWTFGSRYLRPARPDANGKYTMRLTPFDGYRAVVVRGLEDGQFSDPEFLSRALEHATAFRIGEGEAKSLNLRLVEMK
jgi:hypothetical protein